MFDFFIIIIILLIGFFFYISPYVFLIRWSVLYGVFDSFTDRPYGNAFVFLTYLKPFAIKL